MMRVRAFHLRPGVQAFERSRGFQKSPGMDMKGCLAAASTYVITPTRGATNGSFRPG